MKKGIVLIGAAILDVLVRPADRSVFDTGSYPAEDIRLSFGGDALNEASVLAVMGKQVVLHTVLGRDPAGDMIRDYCGRLGIKLGPSAQEEPDGQKGESVLQVPTGINVVLVEEDGERSFLTNKNGSLRGLALSHIPLPFPKDTGIVSLASIFVSPRLSCKDMALLFQAAAGQGKRPIFGGELSGGFAGLSRGILCARSIGKKNCGHHRSGRQLCVRLSVRAVRGLGGPPMRGIC